MYFVVSKYGRFFYGKLSSALFSFDMSDDMFYALRKNWQRSYGYCYLYDLVAPFYGVILDIETIRFSYNNKNWILVFWKGQYGMNTGGEIGVFCNDHKTVNKNTVYYPVTNMNFKLEIDMYKNDELISSVSDNSWWLAFFQKGMFSNPSDLRMNVRITFPNKNMLKEFFKSFIKLGYSYKDYRIEGNIFYFAFMKPHTRRVWTRGIIIDRIKQFYNKKYVMFYNQYLFDNANNMSNENEDVSYEVLEELNKDVLFLPYTPINSEKDLSGDDSVYINPGVYVPKK